MTDCKQHEWTRDVSVSEYYCKHCRINREVIIKESARKEGYKAGLKKAAEIARGRWAYIKVGLGGHKIDETHHNIYVCNKIAEAIEREEE